MTGAGRVNGSITGSSSLLPLVLVGNHTFRWAEWAMPGVDFQEVRSRISMGQVLDLLGFVAQETHGDEVRGACPVHRSSSSRP
jgi:hypothetical protein